jgi:hypothetical protein
MGRLEDSLRDTFAHRVDAPPVVEGLADRAIVGARRVRRRRGLGVSAAAALAVALIAFGGLTIANRPGTQVGPGGPSAIGISSGPAEALPLDILSRGTIYLRDGGTLSLSGLDAVSAEQAWRVDGGYLVSAYKGGLASLWYVPTAGSQTGPARVLETGGRVMVAAGTPERPGVQVAWGDDKGLHLGTFTSGAVTNVVSTRVPAAVVAGAPVPLYPQAVVGGAVVLAGSSPSGGGAFDVWDEWLPARGGYVPGTDVVPFTSMLAMTADREHIIGAYGGTPGCLGEFAPDGFTQVNRLCPSVFSPDGGDLLPSPDGRWWLLRDSLQVRLYDAQQVWQGAGPVRTWSDQAVQAGTGAQQPVPAGAWIDGNSAVLTTMYGAMVVHTDGSVDQLALPDGVWYPKVVVDLR